MMDRSGARYENGRRGSGVAAAPRAGAVWARRSCHVLYEKGPVRIRYERPVPASADHRRRGLNSTIAGLNNPSTRFPSSRRCAASSDLRNANAGQSSGPLD